MVNYYQAKINSLRNIEANTQSTSTAAWMTAGFQAATADQTRRSAAAQEEQLALQQKMAQQTRNHQFAMWRQTPDGIAYLQWRERGIHLAQSIRNRDSDWRQGWARVIGRAQAEIPQDEVQRFVNHPARVRQVRLKVMSVLGFVVAGLAGIGLLFNLLMGNIAASIDAGGALTYDDCLELLKDPSTIMTPGNCEAIKPDDPVGASMVWFVILFVIAVGLVILRTVKRHAARTDPTVPNEAQARIGRWGFDPLAVFPGYVGFAWYARQKDDEYADRLMWLALNGPERLPMQSELIRLEMPLATQPHESHPVEVNEVLSRFHQERS
ncbi:hypothetical protein [Arthrobacter sp. AQ5-05]|uniref:hypothetical protein n=1 Tax=Arthrobacter sp. AQ5-05 TaxID=2184581 RepID=UPI0012B51803|nr:hypothetical protein [Arthrobacter sp. AQ5-05]